jgi:hypothetical protein
MKILIVSQYFWPESFSINDVARSLLEKGVEVDVLTGKPNYPAGQKFAGYHGWGCMREIWNGVSLFRVPLAARGEGGGRRLAVNYLSFVISGMLVHGCYASDAMTRSWFMHLPPFCRQFQRFSWPG